MKSIIAVAVAGLAAVASPAYATTDDDFQIWSSLNLAADLSNRVVGGLELSTRLSDDASRVGLLLVRPTVGYKVADNLVMHIGYAHQVTVSPGVPDVHENRFFQQTNWEVGQIGRVTVNSRTRIEMRTVADARDTGWRLRQRVQLQFPLAVEGTNLLLSSEHFFALNSTDWGATAGFDQMRNFIGVSLPLSKAFQLETGFQHRYQRRVGQPDRSDFILPVTLSYKL